MGHTNSIKKTIRQNLKRRLANKSKKSRILTYEKNIYKIIGLDENNIPNEKVSSLFKKYISYLDKAAQKHIIHKNRANQKKSKMQKFINKNKKVNSKSQEEEKLSV